MDDHGLVPYNFEPEYTEEELHSLEEIMHVTEDVQEFDCACENCLQMPSSEENVCCKHSDFVLGDLDNLNCITEHPDFEMIVLTDCVLQVAFIQIMAFKGNRGRAPDTLSNTQSRLTAYRQFVCWMLRGEKLGKSNRVVIPACVVFAIREKFPSPDGTYTGFKTALASMKDIF